MIFLTVGTQFPFDRLVKAVDHLAGKSNIDEEIFAQIGDSSYKPVNFKAVQTMDAGLFEKFVLNSTAIISHSGMGTIETALRNGKPLLAIPRLKKYGEVVNDHQVAIARKFEAEGHLLAAYHENDIGSKIIELKNFVPRKRTSTSDAVIEKISQFLNSVEKEIYELSTKR